MQKRATVVVDLGFGDAGKGTMVDYLCRQRKTSLVVRFNGGGQAAHNVVLDDGRHHTFSLFGSGTFAGVPTFLSKFVLVDPIIIHNEAEHLLSVGIHRPFSMLAVDGSAKVVTPFQKMANRIREMMRGEARHGSCGLGIGETMSDNLQDPSLVLSVRDLRDAELLVYKLRAIQEHKKWQLTEETPSWVTSDLVWDHERRVLLDPQAPWVHASIYQRIALDLNIVDGEEYLKRMTGEGSLVFEGAQGVLLDEDFGFHPYTTWSKTTAQNASQLLQEIGYDKTVERLGVLRSYLTRHGPGPFPTEDADLTRDLQDKHNGHGQWQGSFRVGYFDAVLAQYALSVCPVDSLAITHMDRFQSERICVSYRFRGRHCFNFPVPKTLLDQKNVTTFLLSIEPCYSTRSIEDAVGFPISITSHGPTASDKRALMTTGIGSR